MFKAVVRLTDMDKDGALEVSADVDLLNGLVRKHVSHEMSKDSVLDAIQARFPLLGPATNQIREMLYSRISVEVGDSNRNGKTDLKIRMSLLGEAFEQEFIYDIDAITLMGLLSRIPSLLSAFSKNKK